MCRSAWLTGAMPQSRPVLVVEFTTVPAGPLGSLRNLRSRGGSASGTGPGRVSAAPSRAGQASLCRLEASSADHAGGAGLGSTLARPGCTPEAPRCRRLRPGASRGVRVAARPSASILRGLVAVEWSRLRTVPVVTDARSRHALGWPFASLKIIGSIIVQIRFGMPPMVMRLRRWPHEHCRARALGSLPVHLHLLPHAGQVAEQAIDVCGCLAMTLPFLIVGLSIHDVRVGCVPRQLTGRSP